MQLPVKPPVPPMLAKRVGELPVGETWIFEPKWDGFRALVFRDGDEILLQSRVVEALELFRVVKIRAHRIGLGGMLVEQFDFQLVRPPVAIGSATREGAVIERAFRLG